MIKQPRGTSLKGVTRTPEYQALKGARRRCNNQNDRSYKYYGGRGIEVRFRSFDEFLAEIGPRPSPEHTLDRIDNDGHYETGNVRWATRKEQRINQRPRRAYAAHAHGETSRRFTG